MAGKVKFYRGAAGTSLPESHEEGAIFILEKNSNNDLGDMYVDIENGKRLHIAPEKEIIKYTSNLQSQTSVLGQVYLFDGTISNKFGIAIGDGSAYIGDLPTYNFQAMAGAIQNKVNAYLGTEYNALYANKKAIDGLVDQSATANPNETLVLSRELWLNF